MESLNADLEAGPPEAERPRVLLVGQSSHLDELTVALVATGLDPEHAEDGAAAFAAFEGKYVQAVVIDLTGAGLDAAEVCEGLVQLDHRQTPKLVVMDAEGDSDAVARAFEAGATDVVARPPHAAFLAQRLASLVRRHAGGQRTGEACSLDRTTGLADRTELVEQVTRACEQARSDGSTLAALHLELDHFRELVHGLATGSATMLLTAVSRRLRACVRSSDKVSVLRPESTTIARVGGGEFCVLVQGLERVEDAAKASRRLLDEFSEPFEVEGRPVSVTANIGIASFPQEDVGPAEFLDRAQTAAYSARQDGLETIRFYDPSMNVQAFERLTLETSMRQGIERDEFVVYYQPRLEISSGRIVGFEALVRWKHPQLGMVAPGQFIPLAEETGLIVPIGEHVLRTACLQNREWQRRGLEPVSISVNLSSIQFQKPELYDTVVRILGETGLDPIWLELELTESLLMQNAEAVVNTLKRFRDTGIKLSIDDFGTGYSSLAYLKRFPIDALKIDRAFIRDVTTNADDAALATSIILMGRSLKLKVVAEGVETGSQLSFLRIMQCDEAQGFLFSQPVPAEDAERLLRDGPNTVAA